MPIERSGPRKTIIALNVALGVLFAVVAAGPIGELFVYRPAFGLQSTVEDAILFVITSAAFFFGAWVLIKTWHRMWRWQLIPLSAAFMIGAAFV